MKFERNYSRRTRLDLKMDTRDAKMTKDVAIQMEGEPERKKKKKKKKKDGKPKAQLFLTGLGMRTGR